MKNFKKSAEITKITPLFKGYRTVDDIEFKTRISPDRPWNIMTREIVHYSACAVGLLYHPETDSFLFTEEFRPAPFLTGSDKPWMIQCCGGAVDPGEDPKTALVREAFEETGAKVIDTELIGKLYPSPGSNDEVFYTYIGRIDKIESGQIHGHIEHGEEIMSHAIPYQDTKKMLLEGEFEHAATVLALYWFEANRERVRQKWAGQK